MPFKLIPTWAWLALGAAVLAIIGLQQIHISQLNLKLNKKDLEISNANLKAQKDKNDIESEWRQRLQVADRLHADELATIQRDLAASELSAGGLRDFVARTAGKAYKACPSLPVPPVDTSDPIGVLAYLSTRSDYLAGVYAKTADERGAAGRGCERAADATE